MPTPFGVEWSREAIDRVLAQVRAYRLPASAGRRRLGLWLRRADFLKAICAYWIDGFDIDAAQADLNRFPQFTATIEDLDIHFVQVVGEAGGKRPLLLTHGWPGSHFEFWDAIEALAFPLAPRRRSGRRLRPGDPVAAGVRLFEDSPSGPWASGRPRVCSTP
ncbi:epoxide hydrolase N-terminal domain-containing protein [Caulobacter segnis]